jgi:hypothetical protein
MPVPNQLWSQKFRKYNLPLTFWVNCEKTLPLYPVSLGSPLVAFTLQVSLNAEEGLYWYHLMRAVRKPKSARAWLSSSFFYTWIVISIVCGAMQFAIAWISFEDMVVQSTRMYLGGGTIELR